MGDATACLSACVCVCVCARVAIAGGKEIQKHKLWRECLPLEQRASAEPLVPAAPRDSTGSTRAAAAAKTKSQAMSKTQTAEVTGTTACVASARFHDRSLCQLLLV